MSISKEQIEKIARVCHEANRGYCEALGDYSQLPWDSAPEWQKKSAIIGVMMHIDHPDAGPGASHESWAKQKIDDGWKYGDIKDPEKKTHPCLVYFEELTKEQQAKDYIFKAIVNAEHINMTT